MKLRNWWWFFFLANLYILALNDILFISVILIVNNKMTEILYNWDFVTNRITSEEEIGERRRSSAISVFYTRTIAASVADPPSWFIQSHVFM